MTMKQRILYVLLLLMCLVQASCVKEDILSEQPQEQPFAPKELLVKFSPEVADMIADAEPTRSGKVTRSGAPSVDVVMELIGAYDLERVFPFDAQSEEQTRKSGLHQWYVVRFGGEYTAEQVAKQFEVLGEVQKIDFNRTIKRAYTGKATPLSMDKLERAMARTTRSAMNDPLLGMQWHLINKGDMFTEGEIVKSVKDADVQCETAWNMTTGNESVIVAVLDEGIFIEQLEKNPARFLPAQAPAMSPAVDIDLDEGMDKVREILSQYPIKTRLNLKGTLVVARDIAHARIKQMLDEGKPMPEYFKKHPVYYAGPAKTPQGMASGSFGPTTAGRMDPYVDLFQKAGGSMVMVAKGNRSQAVTDACKANGGFYLGSIGGPAAVLAKNSIKSVEVVDFPELGMEAVRKIYVENFPAFIIVDDKGNDFFAEYAH